MRFPPLATLCLGLLASLPYPSYGQTASAPFRLEPVRQWHREHASAVLTELSALLSLPNIAADSVGIRRNADLLLRMLERRGATARLLEVPGSPPAVYGELLTPGATRTVVLYAHYDGQPVDPAQWASDPWTPLLRDGTIDGAGRERPVPPRGARLPAGSEHWRLYARSASDDKGPIVAMLAALDALRASGQQPSVNVKFFLEGEEEAGSPHLAAMLRAHADLLRADAWIFADGPVHQSGRMQVVFGVRGVIGLEMTVYGPSRALHSGHYGNWAPNPVAMVAHIIAGMRDDAGRITIAGFHDDVRPLDTASRAALDSLPHADAELRQELAIGRTEGTERLAERVMLPALNVRGIEGGRTGPAAVNAIATEARASIDFRLVPDQRPARVQELVEAHLRAQGYHVTHDSVTLADRRRHLRIVRLQWDAGYPGVRTPPDLPASRAVLDVISSVIGERVIAVPMLGGSLPLYHFEAELGVPLIIVPIVNHDNNQHAANENLRLGNLWRGIEVYAALIADLGRRWEGRGVGAP